MKNIALLFCLFLMVGGCCHVQTIPDEGGIPGIEVPPYPLPDYCLVPLTEPIRVEDNEAEWMRYESSLWSRFISTMYVPEFYNKTEAPAGYLKARMYYPGKWDATMEFFVGCNHFAEPGDIAGLLGDAIALVGAGHLSFGAFQDDLGFDEDWLVRSIRGAIDSIHPAGNDGEFRVEFVLIGYDIQWADHRDVWHHAHR